MRVVFIPGFTQTSASWAGVVAAIGAPAEPVLLEPDGTRTWAEAVAALARQGGAGTWVGYSMGGRLALQVALDFPNLVDHLVLVSTTAGFEDDTDRQQRAAQDEALAESIESDGATKFMERWLAQPMFARVPGDAPGLKARLDVSEALLASTLRNLGTASMPNLWPRLHELRMRVTIVSGIYDQKFSDIADQLESSCASARVRRVEFDAGHAVPLEIPSFLTSLL